MPRSVSFCKYVREVAAEKIAPRAVFEVGVDLFDDGVAAVDLVRGEP
jgi:hypothetical protein